MNNIDHDAIGNYLAEAVERGELTVDQVEEFFNRLSLELKYSGGPLTVSTVTKIVDQILSR